MHVSMSGPGPTGCDLKIYFIIHITYLHRRNSKNFASMSDSCDMHIDSFRQIMHLWYVISPSQVNECSLHKWSTEQIAYMIWMQLMKKIISLTSRYSINSQLLIQTEQAL